MGEELKPQEQAVCGVCGRFGAFEAGGQFLCADCYTERGSCCPEFGGFDLWEDVQIGHEEKSHPLKLEPS